MINLEGYMPTTLEREYSLKRAPQYFWKFRASRWEDEQARDKLFARRRTELEFGKRTVISDYTDWELINLELYLTFVETNIPGEDGKPVAKPGMAFTEFQERVGKLPRKAVLELWEQCREINPHWDPFFVDEEEDEEAEAAKATRGESETTSGDTS